MNEVTPQTIGQKTKYMHFLFGYLQSQNLPFHLSETDDNKVTIMLPTT